MQTLCICFLKICVTEGFYANFHQNWVFRTCGKFWILIICHVANNYYVANYKKFALSNLHYFPNTTCYTNPDWTPNQLILAPVHKTQNQLGVS